MRHPSKQIPAQYSHSSQGNQPELIPPPRPFQVKVGSFKQDKGLDGQDEKDIQPVLPRFGLDSGWSWDKLWDYVQGGNSSDNVRKVIFLGRHGEGAHNLPGSSSPDVEVARKAVDPELTQRGYIRSRTVNAVWQKELKKNIGLPSTIYCSPLTRCLTTNTISLARLPELLSDQSSSDTDTDSEDEPLTTVPPVLVVEKCRERVVIAPEAERKSWAYIQTFYPHFKLEEGFDMSRDPMFTTDENRIELWPDVEWRAIQILKRIYTDANSKNFVYITTHSGFINQFLKVIGHLYYPPKEGCIIPFVCDYKPSNDLYLPLVCKILDDRTNYYLTVESANDPSPNVLSTNIPPPVEPSALIVQKVADCPPLLHKYKWILEPRYVEKDTKKVQYSIQNEWTYNKGDYVTSFTQKDNVENLATETNCWGSGVNTYATSKSTDVENRLFYINLVGDDLAGDTVYEIVPVDRTGKVFGVEGDGPVKLVDQDASGYDIKWKIIAL